MIRPELLTLLRCPKTHQKLVPAPAGVIDDLNARITKRELQNRGGKIIEQQLEEGLVTEDGAWLYPVRGNLPIMLIDEAVAARPQNQPRER
jgi:uncharacterized protein YbaR (Trm112 family)